MKKHLIVLSLFILPLFAMSQHGSVNAYYIKAIRALVLNGDSVKFTNPQNGEVITRVNGVWKNTPGSNYAAVDSLKFNKYNGQLKWYIGGTPNDSTNIDDRYILLSDSSKYVAKQDSGTIYLTPNQINNLVENLSPKVIYEVALPSASSVGDRIANSTPGIDYPSDWVLTVGISVVDLVITHNEGRRVANVTLFVVDGTSEQQLFNTAAYNGIITVNENTLRIQSLATIQKEIKIYIVFV